MNEPGKSAVVTDEPSETVAAAAELTPEQKELLASLERSFQQAARGETRDFLEFLEELRLEREAEDNADNSDT